MVGFEGAEGKGLGGIEQAWDAHLAGQEGRALVERDALGREVTGAPVVLKAPRPGQGVMLTLDATLQYIAEKEIDAAWRRTRARAAMAVAHGSAHRRGPRARDSPHVQSRTPSPPPPTTSGATAR